MNMDPECVPCLLGRVFYQANLCNPSNAAGAMKDALTVLASEYSNQKNSAAIATKVHRAAYDAMAVADPYADLKIQAEKVASSVFEKASQFVSESADPLEAAVRVSIAGNIMDFGVQGLTDPGELAEKFSTLVSQPLAANDVQHMREMISRDSEILYFLDNCGEDVLDVLLVRELQALGAKVTGVAKGEPILTDVTLEDAARIGLDKVFDRMITTGAFAVGVPYEPGPELRRAVDSADLIISKGMGNFEAMSDTGISPIMYLFRAKCTPVAKAAGVCRNDNVAKLVL